MAYTYRTICVTTKERYIGKSVKNPDENTSYLGSGTLLKEAILKHGKENFVKEIIDYDVPEEFLDDLEIMRISEERENFGRWNVLNIADGGAGGDTLSGHPRKKEIYADIAAKVSVTLQGHDVSQKTRDLISEAKKGWFDRLPEEEQKKYSENQSVTMKGFYKDNAHHSKGKKLDLSAEEIQRRSTWAIENGLGKTTFADLSPEKQIETSAKLSAALTGREVTQHTRDKIAASLEGHKVSQETRDKISKTLTGRKIPKDVIEKRERTKRKNRETKHLKN